MSIQGDTHRPDLTNDADAPSSTAARPAVDPNVDQASAVQRLGGQLQRFPPAYNAAVGGLKLIGRIRRSGQISAYLNGPGPHNLRIGAGDHTEAGWLATDLVPVKPAVVFMDATKPFPFPDNSFEVVHCEHTIEHVGYEDGLHMLRESHRVLRSGGILRLITPGLDLVGRLLAAAEGKVDDPTIAEYIRWSNTRFGSPSQRLDPTNAAFVINRLVRGWGHTFIYDEATLRAALANTGFHEIARRETGQSPHPSLRNVDRHFEEIGEAFSELESLTLEATA